MRLDLLQRVRYPPPPVEDDLYIQHTGQFFGLPEHDEAAVAGLGKLVNPIPLLGCTHARESFHYFEKLTAPYVLVAPARFFVSLHIIKGKGGGGKPDSVMGRDLEHAHDAPTLLGAVSWRLVSLFVRHLGQGLWLGLLWAVRTGHGGGNGVGGGSCVLRGSVRWLIRVRG